MVPRKGRLRSSEVREVLLRGRSVRGSYLSVKIQKHTGPARVAVVVKKALVKGSVERNRVRRALYRALVQNGFDTGLVVCFVQKIPPPPLTTAFAAELSDIYKKI